MFARTVVFLALLAVGIPAAASQIFHRTLEEVLEEADWIVVATVVTAQRTNSQHSMDATYKLQVVETLQGKAPAVPVHYSQPIPILYDEEGNEIGMFSPILDGSGSELGLKEGETWIFVGSGPHSEDAQIAFLSRVEPRENLGAITTWLSVKATEKTELPVPEKGKTERSLRGAIGGAWR
jgi:hypothetical protein